MTYDSDDERGDESGDDAVMHSEDSDFKRVAGQTDAVTAPRKKPREQSAEDDAGDAAAAPSSKKPRTAPVGRSFQLYVPREDEAIPKTVTVKTTQQQQRLGLPKLVTVTDAAVKQMYKPPETGDRRACMSAADLDQSGVEANNLSVATVHARADDGSGVTVVLRWAHVVNKGVTDEQYAVPHQWEKKKFHKETGAVKSRGKSGVRAKELVAATGNGAPEVLANFNPALSVALDAEVRPQPAANVQRSGWELKRNDDCALLSLTHDSAPRASPFTKKGEEKVTASHDPAASRAQAVAAIAAARAAGVPMRNIIMAAAPPHMTAFLTTLFKSADAEKPSGFAGQARLRHVRVFDKSRARRAHVAVARARRAALRPIRST